MPRMVAMSTAAKLVKLVVGVSDKGIVRRECRIPSEFSQAIRAIDTAIQIVPSHFSAITLGFAAHYVARRAQTSTGGIERSREIARRW